MNSIKFLFAAYLATWVIHGTYLGTLVRRFARLKKEMGELGKAATSPSSAEHLKD
jgi:CcmD family protein